MGVSGNTFGKWLEIRYLWVKEAERYKGVGKSVVQRIEKAALQGTASMLSLTHMIFKLNPFT